MRDLALLSVSSQSIGRVKPTIRTLFLSDKDGRKRQVSGARGESKVREGSPKKIMLEPRAEEWVTFSHTDSEKGTPFAEAWRYSRGVA